MVLADEEKARIRAEEVFRTEIRRGLDATGPARSRFWNRANSPFGLWFLSSIVLAGLGTAFTAYQNHRAQEVQRLNIERRIVTELSNRVVQALAGYHLDEAAAKSGTPFVPKDVYNNAVLYLNNSFGDNDFSIYPEFRQRNFRSLIVELNGIATPSERLQLIESLRAFEQLVDLASPRGENAQEPVVKEQSEKGLEAIREATNILKTKLIGDYLKSSTLPELHDIQPQK